MIIATLIVAIGLTTGAWAATTRGYRMSGVVVISLLALYTLIDVAALPIFVLSTILAYLGIMLVQERWLVYGRRLLFMAIVLGAVIPVLLYVLLNIGVGQSTEFRELEFLGSILPGIAAYNYYRVDSDRRLRELLASTGLLAGLLVVGVGMLVLWTRPPCITCTLFGTGAANYVTPLPLTTSSDVANLLGLQTSVGPPGVGSLGPVTSVVLLGLALTEQTRSRWGLRPAGVIALPLVVLFSLRLWWVVPLYLAVTVLSYAGIQVIHAWTLLYGRALLSISSVIGVLAATVMLVVLGLPSDLAVFFAGVLGGIGAYNLHIVPPRDRLANVAVSGGILVGLFAVARALIMPEPTGLATTVSWTHVVVSVMILAAASWAILDLERRQPSRREAQAWARTPEEVDQ